MSSNSTSMSPEQILKRLDELKKWQEQQQQLLIQRQNTQRQLLDEEQKLLYERLGFASPVNKQSLPRSHNVDHFDLASTSHLNDSSNQYSFDDNGTLSYSNAELTLSNPNLVDPSIQQNVQSESSANEEKQFIKRPFLKKGEGLTSRFKINPEKFRLNNLPKYKYANKIKEALKAPSRSQESLSKKVNNVDPNPLKSRVNETLPKKFTSTEPWVSKSIASAGTTPNNEHTRKVDFSPPKRAAAEKKKSTNILGENEYSSSLEKSNTEFQSVNSSGSNNLNPISWADVLNPNNIKPISLENLRKFVEFNSDETSLLEEDEFDNLSLFELLEKKAQEGSVLIDSSILERYINNFQNTGPTSDKPMLDTHPPTMKRVSPLPCDIDKKVLADESEESSTESDERNDSTLKVGKCRVRFSDDVVVNEITSESDTDVSILADSKTSTPSDKGSYSSIKDKFFAENSITDSDNSTTITNTSILEHEKDLMEKTDRLKARLADLEREISEFQNHNSELIKLKQECELEKIRFEQERSDLNERLKDEQIKLEIQLHDERMKLEEERKKYEKLIKDTRLKSRKENEDITKLKEQVEHLQKENREKETKHSAAQARLRAQIRNLEKDLKEYSMEIDILKKEKRRLEGENSKLMRQNNSKMLQEINKSIAKLVPKPVQTKTEVKNRNPNPVVAKVTSHTSSLHNRRLSRRSISASSISKSKNDQEESDSDSDSIMENESAYFKSKKPPVPTSEEPSECSEGEAEPPKPEETVKKCSTQDEFKREIMNPDGSKDIWYTNGNLKKISADGMLIRMLYYNKDIKETNINEGTVKYYYAQTNTWQTTYLDGLEILEFPNGQTEHRYKDGTIEVHFENGSIRITNPNDPAKQEEWRYADGTKLIQLKTGDKIISFPNGQKEVHTKVHKRREYPDGTVKIVYPDGSQETRYSNGRVRLKDKEGNLIMDSVS